MNIPFLPRSWLPPTLTQQWATKVNEVAAYNGTIAQTLDHDVLKHAWLEQGLDEAHGRDLATRLQQLGKHIGQWPEESVRNELVARHNTLVGVIAQRDAAAAEMGSLRSKLGKQFRTHHGQAFDEVETLLKDIESTAMTIGGKAVPVPQEKLSELRGIADRIVTEMDALKKTKPLPSVKSILKMEKKAAHVPANRPETLMAMGAHGAPVTDAMLQPWQKPAAPRIEAQTSLVLPPKPAASAQGFEAYHALAGEHDMIAQMSEIHRAPEKKFTGPFTTSVPVAPVEPALETAAHAAPKVTEEVAAIEKIAETAKPKNVKGWIIGSVVAGAAVLGGWALLASQKKDQPEQAPSR